MAEQGKNMKKIDAELFFVIDEKNNTIELTDKGIDLVSGKDDRNFFVMPDIGDEIAKLQKQNLEKEHTSNKRTDWYVNIRLNQNVFTPSTNY